MEQKEKITELLGFMPNSIKNTLKTAVGDLGDNCLNLEEIRFRTNCPISVFHDGKNKYVSIQGKVTETPVEASVISDKDMRALFQAMCEHSVYAYLEEIKQGFITLRGGHRAGICGRVVIHNGSIDNIKDISGINLRIAREVKGAADKIMKSIVSSKNKNKRVESTLIISPPQCGKTTMLRDVARQISQLGINIGISDERSEIAACYKGAAQNDLGLHTDVLDGCPKAAGMMMLLRSMSPQVIITDEISTNEDIYAIEQILHSGVAVIASVHGEGTEDVFNNDKYKCVLGGQGFTQAIVLSRKNGAGTIEKVEKLV